MGGFQLMQIGPGHTVIEHTLSIRHIANFNSLYFCTFWNHETTSQNFSDEAKYSNNLHTSLRV